MSEFYVAESFDDEKIFRRGWVEVTEDEDDLPPDDNPVLVVVSCNRRRWVQAAIYYREKELQPHWDYAGDDYYYDEDADEFYMPPGWYAAGYCEGCEGVQWAIHDTVTHWRPMLPLPEAA